MNKKKVTLSLDSKVYGDFQKFCEKNAIMLSKKIELLMKDILKKKFVFFFFFLLIINLANAATIFSDDFEDGDTSGWTISGAGNLWVNSNADPQAGLRHVQANQPGTTEPGTVIERIVSTSGYQNVTFSYYRKLIGLDAADEFQVEYNTGSGWNILEQTGSNSANDGSYVYQEFNLSSAASNNSNFQIKFECTAGAVSEFCRLDAIIVSGTGIDTSAPIFSGFVESPLNGTVYSTGAIYRFNATITDASGVGLAGIEFNGINYSLQNFSNDFTFNITELAAGTHNYYFWASDTTGIYNTSGMRSYSVVKTDGNISLNLN